METVAVVLALQSVTLGQALRGLTATLERPCYTGELAPVSLVVECSCEPRKKVYTLRVCERSKMVDYMRLYSRFAEIAEAQEKKLVRQSCVVDMEVCLEHQWEFSLGIIDGMGGCV